MLKKGLGRGLGALIPEVEVADRDLESIQELAITSIDSNPRQPRKEFDPVKLEELAASIRQHGVVQPIVVRSVGNRYEIVAGERRWRACQMAGLERIPALVREFTEAETMEIALIENLQRADLNPLEEAEAYQVLIREFSLTQEELARRLGRSRPQISNTLRLLQLGSVARAEVQAGRLSMGHAKVLLGIESEEIQTRVARESVSKGLSVRDLEGLVKRSLESKSGPAEGQVLPPDLREVEGGLREWFGTPVRLVPGEKKGRIEITYFGEEGLSRILEMLGVGDRISARPPKVPFRI